MASVMVTGHGIFMRSGLKKLATLALIASLPACAGSDGRYPSLAQRQFEIAPSAAITVPQPSEPIRPVASSAILAALRDKAKSAYGTFARQQSAATPLVRAAAGEPVESNTRAAALVAMASLASARGATSTVMADLDLLAADAATTFAPTADIDVARAEVLALIESEDAVMAQLWEILGQ